MATLPLLAIGGPRHGEFIGDGNSPAPVFVPIMTDTPPVERIENPPFMRRYCVHGARITSRMDGDRHFVSATQVARLYGLAYDEWTAAEGLRRPLMSLGHPTSEYCLFPDPSGAYSRHNLPRLLPDGAVYRTATTIRKGRYERKAVSDRGVYIYRGEE